MNRLIQYHWLKGLWIPFCLLVFMVVLVLQTQAQSPEKPPRPIEVTVSNAQHLNFGTIIPTSDAGGTVVVEFNNSSVKSGDILQLHSFECTAALFIVDAEPGVLINIIYPEPDPKLNNSVNHLQMHLGVPYVDNKPGFQIITKAKSTYVYIGGTLEINSLLANPAGNYSGTFQVTFIQQ